ncbi:hypothetical protein KUTeg_003207 [Tegillarca granosa]|uniref:Cadherin domain-containing protein n=1 Tax=Tegillarca granosa TaxID=220873 RepID=A0ABQ9FPN4_TEGGR|nr:hypothetical protein KUTeg_003207 [Tegillarca granosa]
MSSFILILATVLPTAFLLKSLVDEKTAVNQMMIADFNNKIKDLDSLAESLQKLETSSLLRDAKLTYLENQLSALKQNKTNSDSIINTKVENVINSWEEDVSKVEDMTQCLACNPSIPTWSSNSYTFNVKESVTVGTVIGKLLSNVCTGYGVSVAYTMYKGFNFTINKVTGEIITATSLDREKQQRYEHIVSATVSCTEKTSKSQNVSLAINIEDVNDNAPVFTNTNYNVLVSPSARIGEQVLSVTAIDRDENENGQVQYEKTPESVPFKIDQQFGTISVASSFDSSVYNFQVLAKDGGSPQLSSSANVTITLRE